MLYSVVMKVVFDVEDSEANLAFLDKLPFRKFIGAPPDYLEQALVTAGLPTGVRAIKEAWIELDYPNRKYD